MRGETVIRAAQLARKRLAVLPELGEARPKTRAECENGPRPCPWVSCRHNLYLEISDKGSLKLVFPDLEPEAMEHSCSLDLAERGGMTLEDTAYAMNLTRERVRQLELMAVAEMQVKFEAWGLTFENMLPEDRDDDPPEEWE